MRRQIHDKEEENYKVCAHHKHENFQKKTQIHSEPESTNILGFDRLAARQIRVVGAESRAQFPQQRLALEKVALALGAQRLRGVGGDERRAEHGERGERR